MSAESLRLIIVSDSKLLRNETQPIFPHLKTLQQFLGIMNGDKSTNA